MSGGVQLAVRGLKVATARSGVAIVDDVAFEVAQGTVFGLVGESGSGKSTVALALLGHARPGLAIAGGQVTVGRTEVLALSGPELANFRGKRAAYVAQDPSSALNPGRTVGFQLREPLLRHGPPEGVGVDERLAEMLHEVKLEHVRGVLAAFPHQLSGGQQQRVMLAMAFACRPDVIVLDEPTTGLDVTTQRRVLETVRDLCGAYGAAAVYVSHDLAVVAELADTVAVMYAGRIVEYGLNSDVLQNPRHPYTRGLIGTLPGSSTGGGEALPGRAPRPGMRPAGCAFAPRCSYARDECREVVPAAVPVAGRGGYVRCIRSEDIRHLRADAERPRPARATAEGAAAILVVDRVSASYGDSRVVDEVSVALQPGRTLAIVGESGSGKTTLARCIVGLHRRWSGSITYDGNPLSNDPARRNATSIDEIQYIFQNPYTSLNPRKTVRYLLEQPLRARLHLSAKRRHDRIVAALDQAALGPEFLDRYPGQLSGGERQRVAIARALVLHPRLLVCDEITSALDVSVQASIVKLLQSLQESHGLSLVFITHNLALVEMIADTTAVIMRGRVIEIGATEAVLTEPSAEYTTQLLADAPALPWERGPRRRTMTAE